MNVSPFKDNGLTAGIIRYDTPKVNNDGMIIIPQDMVFPKPNTLTQDYIAACLPYHPVFYKHC